MSVRNIIACISGVLLLQECGTVFEDGRTDDHGVRLLYAGIFFSVNNFCQFGFWDLARVLSFVSFQKNKNQKQTGTQAM